MKCSPLMCNMVDLVRIFPRKSNLQVHYFCFTFLLDFCTKEPMYLSSNEKPKDSRASMQYTGHCEIRFIASKPCILQFPTVKWIYCTAPDLNSPAYGRTVHLQINHFLARKNYCPECLWRVIRGLLNPIGCKRHQLHQMNSF